jgi:hypothetical protein
LERESAASLDHAYPSLFVDYSPADDSDVDSLVLAKMETKLMQDYVLPKPFPSSTKLYSSLNTCSNKLDLCMLLLFGPEFSALKISNVHSLLCQKPLLHIG